MEQQQIQKQHKKRPEAEVDDLPEIVDETEIDESTKRVLASIAFVLE